MTAVSGFLWEGGFLSRLQAPQASSVWAGSDVLWKFMVGSRESEGTCCLFWPLILS